MLVLRQPGTFGASDGALSSEATAAAADVPARTFRYSRKQTDEACRKALCTASAARVSGLDAITTTMLCLPTRASVGQVQRPDLSKEEERSRTCCAACCPFQIPAVAEAFPAHTDSSAPCRSGLLRTKPSGAKPGRSLQVGWANL